MPSVAGIGDYPQVHPLHQGEGVRCSLGGTVEAAYHTLGPTQVVAVVAAVVRTAAAQEY